MRIHSEFNILYIDGETIKENYDKIRAYIGGDFISVVKADAYGLGASLVAKVLYRSGQRRFAVATLKEALKLRKTFDGAYIYILGAVDERDYAVVNKYKLICPIVSRSNYENIKRAAVKPERVYIQIDTGMNRLGFKDEDNAVNEAIDYFSNGKFEFYGVFSHFAKGDNLYICREQIKKLKEINCERVSFSASDAASLKHGLCETPRIGLALFGVGNLAEKAGLKFPISLKTKVIRVANARAGERAGYNRYYLKNNCRLATIPMGYADGLKRSFVGQRVKIGGKAYPIISVCMDMSIIKADRDVREGCDVVIFDSAAKLEQLALADKTITYEILTSLGQRVKRRLKKFAD